jgi:hypothetical protein
MLCSCAQNIVSTALHVVESYQARTLPLSEGNQRIFGKSAHRKKPFVLGVIVHYSYVLSWVARSEREIRILPLALEYVSVLCFVA